MACMICCARRTPAGDAKVLDFGLAKAFDTNTSNPNLSNSPTLATMAGTSAGVILGTAAYMSPEQASGRRVDRRSDIWSFGVVLCEVLRGKQLFRGDTAAHVLADVFRAPIDFSQLPKETLRGIIELLRRCLDRDIRTRLRDIGEARIAIQNPREEPETERAAPQLKRSSWAIQILAALGWISAVSLAAWVFLRPAPSLHMTRFEIYAPEGSKLPLGTPAPSPDGRWIAYTVTDMDGLRRIHLRSMDSIESRVLPGTETAVHPFW